MNVLIEWKDGSEQVSDETLVRVKFGVVLVWLKLVINIDANVRIVQFESVGVEFEMHATKQYFAFAHFDLKQTWLFV